jgi:hypothetical protein
MSFKVGDVVTVIDCDMGENRHLIGAELVVTGIGASYIDRRTEFFRYDGVKTAVGAGEAWRPECLRLVPPNKAQSDFTAGDWELCPWQPYKKRETA